MVIKFREVGCISCEMVHVTRRSIGAHLVADLANTDAAPLKRQHKFLGHSCLFVLDKQSALEFELQRAERKPAHENIHMYFS